MRLLLPKRVIDAFAQLLWTHVEALIVPIEDERDRARDLAVALEQENVELTRIARVFMMMTSPDAPLYREVEKRLGGLGIDLDIPG